MQTQIGVFFVVGLVFWIFCEGQLDRVTEVMHPHRQESKYECGLAGFTTHVIAQVAMLSVFATFIQCFSDCSGHA